MLGLDVVVPVARDAARVGVACASVADEQCEHQGVEDVCFSFAQRAWLDVAEQPLRSEGQEGDEGDDTRACEGFQAEGGHGGDNLLSSRPQTWACLTSYSIPNRPLEGSMPGPGGRFSTEGSARGDRTRRSHRSHVERLLSAPRQPHGLPQVEGSPGVECSAATACLQVLYGLRPVLTTAVDCTSQLPASKKDVRLCSVLRRHCFRLPLAAAAVWQKLNGCPSGALDVERRSGQEAPTRPLIAPATLLPSSATHLQTK